MLTLCGVFYSLIYYRSQGVDPNTSTCRRPPDGSLLYMSCSGWFGQLPSHNRQQRVDFSRKGRQYFDLGLRLMLSYQHEMASRVCFFACLQFSGCSVGARVGGAVPFVIAISKASVLQSACHFDAHDIKASLICSASFPVSKLPSDTVNGN
jgi:hypothetical protein